MVEPEGDLEEGSAVSGTQNRPVLPALRHGAVLPRGCAGLQDGQGNVRLCALPGQGRGKHLSAGVDDDPVDAAVEHGAVREPDRHLLPLQGGGRSRVHHGEGADGNGFPGADL